MDATKKPFNLGMAEASVSKNPLLHVATAAAIVVAIVVELDAANC